MIWKTAAYLWKISCYAPDSIVFYEAFFGVVTQHSSVRDDIKTHRGYTWEFWSGYTKTSEDCNRFQTETTQKPLGAAHNYKCPTQGSNRPRKEQHDNCLLKSKQKYINRIWNVPEGHGSSSPRSWIPHQQFPEPDGRNWWGLGKTHLVFWSCSV